MKIVYGCPFEKIHFFTWIDLDPEFRALLPSDVLME